MHDDLSSLGQRIAQTAFVWLLPILGALLALYLKRTQLERHSGTYPEPPDVGDDFGITSAGRRHTNRTSESSTSISESATSND
jgi:hypothetical protein